MVSEWPDKPRWRGLIWEPLLLCSRLVGMRRALVLATVVIAAGCSGGAKHSASPTTAAPPIPVTRSPSLPVRATAECRAALKQPDTFVNALPTTVGAIHAVTGGPGNVRTYTYIYKGKPDGSFAAWCWRRVPDGYRSYVVGPGAPIFLNFGTNVRPPPGPLLVI
jgi:hypothetical protein